MDETNLLLGSAATANLRTGVFVVFRD